jgi:hypothetical protein
LTNPQNPTRFIAGTLNSVNIMGVDVNGNLQDISMCNVTPIVTLTSSDVGTDGLGAGVSPLVSNPNVTLLSGSSECTFTFEFTATAVYLIDVMPLQPAIYTLRVSISSFFN